MLRQGLQWFMVLAALGLAGCVVHEREVRYRPVGPPPGPGPGPGPVVVEEPAVEQPTETVVTTFYSDLSPYGEWVVVEGYGRCWYPRGVARGWRPYTVGHWAYTSYGWTWVSEEAWGHACYHYGRWFEHPRYGWVWMPGSTWGPAWVSWRSGGGYVGWAPLSPSISIRAGVRIGEVETRSIPAAHYTFVEERHITQPRIVEHVVNVQNNVTIVNKTTNITNITTNNRTVVNNSLSVAHVETVTKQKVTQLNVKEVTTTKDVHDVRAQGNVAIYKPKPLVDADKARWEPHH